MIKATFYTSHYYLNNRQFCISDENVNRDNCLYPFYLLRKKFAECGVDLSTQDINVPADSNFIIYNEMPIKENIIPEKDNYLLMLESKIIRYINWDTKKHGYFKKIFTWDDKIIDNQKYIKINYAQKIPSHVDLDKKDKLCVVIASHKHIAHPLEIYSERINAIRWFEKNHQDEFDLYGMGWDKYCFSGIFSKLNRFISIRKLIKPNYPSYKGEVKSKNEILRKYKFSICYENAKNLPGYITEKIFDCFFALCVPIYLGSPNITAHIPKNAFIDMRNFKNYEELYSFLKNMTNKRYMDYLEAINNFIKSNKIYPFSAECFAETLSNEILGRDV